MSESISITSDEAAYRVLLLAGERPGRFGRLRAARVVGGFAVPARDEESPAELARYQVQGLGWSMRDCKALIDALHAGGLLTETCGNRPTLVLTVAGYRALDALEHQRAAAREAALAADTPAPAAMSDSDLVAAIHEVMDGEEWSADTTQAIAELLHANGYPISDPAS